MSVVAFLLLLLVVTCAADDGDRNIVCAMRSLAVSYAAYLRPADVSANWSALVYDGLQLSSCPNTPTRSPPSTSHFDVPTVPSGPSCAVEVFVDGTNGADSNSGTLTAPVQTLDKALRLTRARRISPAVPACITIRAGYYDLGATNTGQRLTNSAIGYLSLTSADSSLTVAAYQLNGVYENVTLSGARRITPQWTPHKRTPNGIIYSTKLPDDLNIDWNAFNELYLDGRRVPRARWPNADPSTQGLHTPPSTGWIKNATKWLKHPTLPGETVKIVVSTPNRNGTAFPFYHLFVGGGADSLYSPPRSYWASGSMGAYPSGFNYHPADLPHVQNWTDPTSGPGYIHAYHGGHWGQWMFTIGKVDIDNHEIEFGTGGWQEGRGSKAGAEWYVDNVFEELDAPNEWFVDRQQRLLYFMPNISAPMPTVYDVSQRPCIISIHGSQASPVEDITIAGITFAHTSNTFFQRYDVPSGGDWTVHRGGAIFVTGSSRLTIHHSLLTELGGNALVLSDWNMNATITHNECVWIGDSCILAVGSAQGVNGISSVTQPTNTVISSNILHEMGIYTKQSSAVMTAVSRSTKIIGNVMFNCPRALVNVNDGFYGDIDMHHNLFFGAIRETNDHGPFNSWDRQVYLTYQKDKSCSASDSDSSSSLCPIKPSSLPGSNLLHHNFVINSYNSVWGFDHDDGSSYYYDYHNLFLYAGSKNYIGNNKHTYTNLFAYVDYNTDPSNPGDPRKGSTACTLSNGALEGISGYDETFINNTCILTINNTSPVSFLPCSLLHKDLFPLLANNTYYSNNSITPVCNQPYSWSDWQKNGLDIGSQVLPLPSLTNVINMAKGILEW